MEENKLFELTGKKALVTAAVFLASGEASYVTGVVLPVDGGNAIGF